ncbi:MAG TPA: glycosyltransferase family 4 protein [Mucilaginibacter sp.]|jgi:glycosyltransferase involved in cell wall biosynthesis|nr:glycosyltransferase family 4 protein [Mucilaginibacter sp.]
MKKVLLLTDVNFWERSSGNRARIYSLVNYLAGQVQLTVVNTGPAPPNIETALGATFKAEFHVLEKTKYLSSTGYGRRLKALIKDRHFDTVIIEYIHSSYFLNFLIEDTQVILDAHDIISKRAEEFKKFDHAGALYELSAETEKELFSVYDRIMVLCSDDFDTVDAMAGSGKALLCPHPVEPVAHPIRPEVKNIVFAASAYLPNRDAINWFIKNCWPHISAKYPVILQIYGTVCSGIGASGQSNVILNGFVNDIESVYGLADIVINPVRFGAGMKIKNVEALAHGRPLVTTAHGARGIESGINNSFLVANDQEGFIRAICLLIDDIALRKELSKLAHRLIGNHFSAQNCFKSLIEAIS